MAAKTRKFGFAFDRPGPGRHEVWRNAQTGRKVNLPHHSRDMAEGTPRAILREAGIDVEAFLRA
ncbi:MAG: type II toxin-antitoxin system HicA family toxin [Phycisphaerae bacterium]